jgi:poly(rC)-binding protein 2/3/4
MPNGLPGNRATLQSQREITIANDLIGCIIGRGGQKISEIRLNKKKNFILFIYFERFVFFSSSRQASGANIKIADLDEGSQDRHVTISGTPEQIQLAEFLIHSRYKIFYF